MTSDLEALFATIAANPSDDVARLVYADCLEEHGNAPRAAFIRLQIEAERLHPNSHARLELNGKVQALFAEHWIDWWGEVCAAADLPQPVPKAATRLGRLAGRLALRRADGAPYARDPKGASVNLADPTAWPQGLLGMSSAYFRGGFPDSVTVSGNGRNFLTAWARVSPLDTIYFIGDCSALREDGPYLAGLRRLALGWDEPDVVPRLLQSPHLIGLESLDILPGHVGRENFATELELIFAVPRVQQLKELIVTIGNDRAAEVLAGAANLAGLESLWVGLSSAAGLEESGRWLTFLARSPRLAGLKKLIVFSPASLRGLAALVQNPTWTGLQKLDLYLQNDYERLDPLASADGLPQLDDVTIGGIRLDREDIAALVAAPMLKRVRHFSLQGSFPDRAALSQLTGAVDRDRIETFFLGLPPVDVPGAPDGTAALREHFGAKLRVISD